jgi:hypothetical protein
VRNTVGELRVGQVKNAHAGRIGWGPDLDTMTNQRTPPPVHSCHCNKIPEAINLQREKVYFGSWFWRFWFKIQWPYFFGSVARVTYYGESM